MINIFNPNSVISTAVAMDVGPRVLSELCAPQMVKKMIEPALDVYVRPYAKLAVALGVIARATIAPSSDIYSAGLSVAAVVYLTQTAATKVVNVYNDFDAKKLATVVAEEIKSVQTPGR